MNDRANIPRRIVEDLPLTRMLPNMLTLFSLCAGLTAVRFALESKWYEAVLSIVVAALLDVLDGGLARMLNIASKFGAELDSLSDVISFGVAPSLILYEWTLKDSSGLGWIAVLVYTVCTAMRLARFNTMLEDKVSSSWKKRYSMGVPAPGGGGLSLLPLILVLTFGPEVALPPAVTACWVIVVAGLMISRLPTFLLKGWRVPRVWVAPVFVFAVLLIAAFITHTWPTLSGVGIVYLFSLPCSWLTYRQRQRADQGLTHA
jgi:CDP-diacylglycerol---serine O-phosphatidyltransferase